MSDLDILVAIEVIKRLKARYFRFVDTKQWRSFGELFTDDARFHGALGTFVGREQIIAHCRLSVADAVTVHHGYQPEIEITDAVSARGIWAMDDYNEWPAEQTRIGIRGYGHYHETYARQDGTWRISSSRLTRIRVDPIPGGRLPDFLAGRRPAHGAG
jgi:SnoaL-like domain